MAKENIFDNGTNPVTLLVAKSTVSTTGVIIIIYKRAGRVKTGAILA